MFTDFHMLYFGLFFGGYLYVYPIGEAYFGSNYFSYIYFTKNVSYIYTTVNN